MASWDYIAKIVSLGDSATGKSSLTIRLCEGRFSPHHDVTIGVEFGSRIVPVGPPALKKKLKLSNWDTAGQEQFKSLTRSYFRGASGALLVFDLTRRETFDHVTEWLNDLRQIAEEGIIVVLVGNKSDLTSTTGDDNQPNKRQVTRQEAEEWCKRNNVMQYVETSAKSGDNVEQAFLELAERIYENIEAGQYDLNDRRSGVKGRGASSGNNARTVNLGVKDKAGGKGRSSCC